MNTNIDKEAIKKSLKKSGISSIEKMEKGTIPPFSVVNSLLLRSLRIQRSLFIVIVLILIGFIGFTLNQNSYWRNKAENVEPYILPSHINIPEFFRVRAGAIPKDRVFEFVDIFLARWGNMSYDALKNKEYYLTKYMAPALKAEFRKEFRNKVKRFHLLKIDQIADFERVKEYTRTQKKLGLTTKTVYQITTWGRIRRYYEGRAQPTKRIRVKLAFTTTHVVGDKSWLFEIIEISEKTSKEVLDESREVSTH